MYMCMHMDMDMSLNLPLSCLNVSRHPCALRERSALSWAGAGGSRRRTRDSHSGRERHSSRADYSERSDPPAP